MRSALVLLAALIGLLPLKTAGGQTAGNAIDIEIGPETGLPIPRFVALRVDEARMRAQPTTNHAILFIYLRPGLPMLVLEERGDWRRVRDHTGEEGWMKNTILSNDRTFRVLDTLVTMHLRADSQSPVRAELEEGVVGNISLCRRDGWCRVSVETNDTPPQQLGGWVQAAGLWGVFPGEEF